MRYRVQIRKFFGFSIPTSKDEDKLTLWLIENSIPEGHSVQQLIDTAYQYLRDLKIEPFTPDQIERFVRFSIQRFENDLFKTITSKLSIKTRESIDNMLVKEESDVDNIKLSQLKNDPGKSNLKSVLTECAKLNHISILELQYDFLKEISTNILRQYHQRVMGDPPSMVREYKPEKRYAIMAIFCWMRYQIITDGLVDILIQITHKISTKAEKKVINEFINDIKHVTGKTQKLYKMAEVSILNPKGVIEDVLYPAVGEETLKDLVKEYNSSGLIFKQKVHTVMRASFSHHYRQMLPPILKTLEFNSGNSENNAVLKAVKLLKKYADSSQVYYPADEDVPVEGVIRSEWKENMLEKNNENPDRINRINYELGVLPVLRDRLRCKEIWVKGANRYRNPDEDLPTDFSEKRNTYYKALKLPLKSDEFVSQLQQSMRDALDMFDKGMPTNSKVKLLKQKKGKKGWISLSPLEAQKPPSNLEKVKKEIFTRWQATSLLDILKESDLRIDFATLFKSSASREILDQKIIQKRLLLSLFAIATNTGLKRITSGNPEISYEDLRYIRRRFINKTHIRNAITKIANEIFRIRDVTIWGEATTACASDSKKFGAWDQNLMTEWHIRYRGRGIMIYWHVEKGALCIYSQLKTCSSSEVAAMIKGVLRHCTTMNVKKNYVDSHGQSSVGFAFSHLLGFDLLPRLKGIHSKKLYRPDTGKSDAYQNLQHILTRPVKWNLFEEQYDQMVKYTTALRLATADPEDILRRFIKNDINHPTYQALIELGNVIETIFLCQYLNSEELRQEIQEGLNIVELWNSVNGFIFFGKGGDFSSNRREDQEVSMLCLHLLQNCMIYMNTLMIQQVLSEPKWRDLMQKEDYRALTPLIHGHINPYGTFELDMSKRLSIN